MSHIKLDDYYKRLFALIQYHKWDGEWIENLIPWELDIMVLQLQQHLEEERARQERQQSRMKA